jgi:hypothetical protein
MYIGFISDHADLTAVSPFHEVFALILLVIAACESAIGLGILIVLQIAASSISFQNFQVLGG